MSRYMAPSTQEMLELAAHGMPFSIDATGYKPKDRVAIAASYLQKVDEIIAEYRAKVERIRTATIYSAEGKAQVLGELVKSYLPRFDFFNDFLADAKKKLKEMRDAITVADTAGTDASAQAIREVEVRSRLPRDPVEVYSIFREAIETGEKIVFDAIRNAPAFMKVLPPDQVAEGEVMWQAKRDPTNVKLVTDLRNAITSLEGSIARAKQIVLTEAGFKVNDDPIAAMAQGGAEGAA